METMVQTGEVWREEGWWWTSFQCPKCGRRKKAPIRKVFGAKKKPPKCKCKD
jgi:hypothetical protein